MKLSIILLFSFCAVNLAAQTKKKEKGNKIYVAPYVTDTTISKDSCRLIITFSDFKNQDEIDSLEVRIIHSPSDSELKILSKDFILSRDGVIQLAVPIGSLAITSVKPCTKNSRENFKVKLPEGGVAVAILIDLTPKSSPPGIGVRPNMVKKPVIYAYSDTDLEVTFKLKTEAQLTFTYPLYDLEWNTTVQADGGFTVNGSDYPYLFWEGKMDLSAHIEDPKEGFIIEKDSVISFLETQLDIIGLNSTEKTDFITFWAPQMMTTENYYVKFLIDEDYNEHIGSLDCSIEPDSEIRVFMIYSPNPNFKTVNPQVFKPHNRQRFTVVEWGGAEVLPIIYSQD